MPLFRCNDVGEKDEYARQIEATDQEKAACEYAEYRDHSACEYPPEREVVVIHPDGSRVTLTVDSAAVREYWVRRKRRA